jgi:RNA polymerase sigma-70 factor (ECF subfamily)
MLADATPFTPLSEGVSVLEQMRPALFKYFLRKTGSVAEAEDLTQDVLVRSLAHTHWTSVEEAKGYLFRSAVNRWRDRQRKDLVQRPTVEWNTEAEEHLGTECPPDRLWIAREELSQIFRALEEMNERTRTVMILIKVEQLKVVTVAEMLGISVRAVNKHLAKGIEVLMRLRKRQEWVR